jgi:hypothetical protein
MMIAPDQILWGKNFNVSPACEQRGDFVNDVGRYLAIECSAQLAQDWKSKLGLNDFLVS